MMVDKSMILEGYKLGLIPKDIAKFADSSLNTVYSYLRYVGLLPKRKNTSKTSSIIEAHSLGLNQYDAGLFAGISQSEVSRIWAENGLKPHKVARMSGPVGPKWCDKTLIERLSFLRSTGIDTSGLEKASALRIASDKEVMLESIKFFESLGADPMEVYRKHPSFLSHDRKHMLQPKLEFLVGTIGFKKHRLASKPSIFEYPLETLQTIFDHYKNVFGGNENQSKLLLRSAPSIFGYNTKTIDDKILVLSNESINFHRNYSLLEKDPKKVIATRDYLNNTLRIKEPENGEKWYYMLLSVDKETIQPKVEYCDREGIHWQKYPRILILGFGTDKKQGTLRRRVELIKGNFNGSIIPLALDYKINPAVLD